MSAAIEFNAEKREKFGTGAARELRNNGFVPAIVYSKGKEPVNFSIEERVLKTAYQKGGFFGKIVTLNVGKEKIMALPKDMQFHPVSDRIQHADFLKVEEGEQVTVLIPVNFLNIERCVGIRRGGNLNVVRHDLELLCDPKNIPTQIEVDLKEANIGDSIHISHITLPEGAEPTIERDYTIATIAGRVSKATEEAETAEGEVAEGEEAEGAAEE